MRERLLLAVVITFSLSCLQELSAPSQNANLLPRLEQAQHQLTQFLIASIAPRSGDPTGRP